MSSSNRVRVAVIEESAYGTTPGSGNFSTARYTSESLSGTPQTVESQQIRTDRMSSGQVVTGLEVGGNIEFELAKESVLEMFMESAMYNTFSTLSQTTRDFDIDVTGNVGTLTAATGNFTTDGYKVGDFVTISGAASNNNVSVMLTSVATLILGFIGPDGMTDETGSGTAIKRFDKLSIGTTKKSFSIEKKFEDLTTKGIIYRGSIVAEMELNVAYGELVTGSFTFSGNGYETADSSGELITNSRTVDAPATTQTMNGSVDMPFLGTSAGGSLSPADFAIQSVNLKLSNNLSPQNSISEIAPLDYSAGTCRIEVSMSAYLKNESWSLLPKKLTQDSFSLGFLLKNSGGKYGVYIPALQVSFDDPSVGGADQDISLEMTGQAKVGDSGESALVIYKST